MVEITGIPTVQQQLWAQALHLDATLETMEDYLAKGFQPKIAPRVIKTEEVIEINRDIAKLPKRAKQIYKKFMANVKNPDAEFNADAYIKENYVKMGEKPKMNKSKRFWKQHDIDFGSIVLDYIEKMENANLGAIEFSRGMMTITK